MTRTQDLEAARFGLARPDLPRAGRPGPRRARTLRRPRPGVPAGDRR